MIGSLITNIFLAGIFAHMSQWIHSMQFIIHLPILGVLVPSNVSAYLQSVVPIFTFDFLPSELTTEFVFDFDYPKQRE